MTPWETLVEGAKAYGLSLSASQIKQFQQLYDLLLEGNQRMNLTRITEEGEFVRKHLLDSLALFAALELPENTRFVDIGAGAGFPALPLLITRPSWSGLLVESVKKKAQFLEETIQALGLPGTACPERAEDLGKNPAFREKFDLSVARAVAELAVLAELCLPLVKVGGWFVAYKGGEVQAELEEAKGAVQKLGGAVEKVISLELPEGAGARTLILIEKKTPTPAAYPRPAGIPQRKKLR